MYKIFELYDLTWLEAMNTLSLEDVKKAIAVEGKRDDIRAIRIDKDNIPLVFCALSPEDVSYCIANLEKIESAVMYMHRSSEIPQRVVSSRQGHKKKEVHIPKKTTKKHLRKLLRSSYKHHYQ